MSSLMTTRGHSSLMFYPTRPVTAPPLYWMKLCRCYPLSLRLSVCTLTMAKSLRVNSNINASCIVSLNNIPSLTDHKRTARRNELSKPLNSCFGSITSFLEKNDEESCTQLSVTTTTFDRTNHYMEDRRLNSS